MAKNTVVFLSLAYYPCVGGAEKQTQALAEAWAARGKQILVLTRRVPHAPHEETIGGVHIVRLRSLWWPGLSWVTFCAAALWTLWPRVRNISCIVAVMLNAGALPGAILARLAGIPLIVRPSAGGPGGNVDELSRSWMGRMKLTFLLESVAYFVAMNQEVAADLLAAGVPAGKIQKIPNGVDTRQYSPSVDGNGRYSRQRLGLSESDPVVLFVGRLERVKNLDALVETWPSVIRQLPQARLLMVGDGAENEHLRSLIQEKGLTSSIRMEGAQTNLVPYYLAADVFVLPSHREGISNALLEAMACGLVPVASRVGGSREIIEGLSSDLLIDPEAKDQWPGVLVGLLRDPNRRQELSLRARAIMEEHFSSSTCEKSYSDILTSVTRPIFRRPFPILAYHRVLPSPVYGVDISCKEFDRQMAWLAQNHYRIIPLAEFDGLWRQGGPWPTRTVILTFDDGHDDFYQHARPILERYGFRATVFVNTGLLGKTYWVEGRRPSPVRWHETVPPNYDPASSNWRTYEFMSWEQVRELHTAGYEIASHAVTHPFLTALSDADLMRELKDSKKDIFDKLGAPTDFFCYPSGDFDARVQKAVHDAGYRGAVYSPGHYDLTYYWNNPYALERIGIWRDVTFWKFKWMVKGWYPRVYRLIPSPFWSSLRSAYRLLTGSKFRRSN